MKLTTAKLSKEWIDMRDKTPDLPNGDWIVEKPFLVKTYGTEEIFVAYWAKVKEIGIGNNICSFSSDVEPNFWVREFMNPLDKNIIHASYWMPLTDKTK